MKRKTVLFIVNGNVMGELRGDIYANQIDEFSWVIAEECEVCIDEVDTEIVEFDMELSTIDSTPEGFVVWTDVNFKVITGVRSLVELGSNEHLDLIIANNFNADCLELS